jgi:hypothetical protein
VVGELTNHPDGGGNVFTPDEADVRMGTLFTDPNADVEKLVGTVEQRPAEERAPGGQPMLHDTLRAT